MSYHRPIPTDEREFLDYLLETGPFAPPTGPCAPLGGCGGGDGSSGALSLLASPSYYDLDSEAGSLLGHLNLYALFRFYFYSIIVAYPLYRFMSSFFQFPGHEKSFATHQRDLLNAFLYGFVLYVLGGFQEGGSSMHLILWFYVGLFGFGLGTKLLHLSSANLTNVRSWNMKTWTVMGVLQAVVLVGIYYLLLAACAQRSPSLYDPYASGFLINLKILVPLATFFILLIHYLLFDRKDHAFHLHHWQIFYTLAMLYSGGHLGSDCSSSLFGANVCQAFVGLFMGAYMHGVIGFGFDPLVVKKDAKGREVTNI